MNTKSDIIPLVLLLLLLMGGCVGIGVYELTHEARSIEAHGKVVGHIESVSFGRRSHDEPTRYYKMRTAVHEDGTHVKEPYSRRKEISEWEYNNFMEKHFTND